MTSRCDQTTTDHV